MKNLLLHISILIVAFGCTQPEPEQQRPPVNRPIQSDTLPLIARDTDSVEVVLTMMADSVVEDEISPELRKRYGEVKAKMIAQQPPVRRVGDGFKYNLTKEEWEIYNKVQNHKLKVSNQFQAKKDSQPK